MRNRAVPSVLIVLLLLAGGVAGLPRQAAAASCSSVTADGRCGMDLVRAWKHFTKGDPGVVISYIEGGINWHLEDSNGNVAERFSDRVYVNWRETPVPCGAKRASRCHRVYARSRARFDTNHDGFVNAADWKHDPRVKDANGNGYIDAEDLIVAFPTRVDHDHNGYPGDISGWDFYDGQNDPATYDATYDHSDGQMTVLHHECPNCMIMPIKAGAEALDRTEDLAQAWLYSVDAGVSVITSVTADLGYSNFMRDAVNYAQRHGVAMVEASNDFDTPDHQGGMFWPEVLPGNSVVPNSNGDGWIRSDYTSWGPHNVFSVAASSGGGTTSESTPTTAGVVGLLLSWGRVAARRGIIPRPITGPEAEQVMRMTARRITDPSLAWPGSKGEWNQQYGYGIPELYDAMVQVAEQHIPPIAWIQSPSWYQLVDPTKRKVLAVRGTITARFANNFHWVLQAGLGPQPKEKDWFTVGRGSAGHHFSGTLGTLRLSRVPKSFWSAPFALSQTKEEETAEQYDVTFRLKVTATRIINIDGARLRHRLPPAEDRRVISVTHDSSWLPHFPIKVGASGESEPAVVDMLGIGTRDVVFGDTNGVVRAIDPTTGHELPGWPVHTDPVQVLRRHRGVHPGHEPIVGDVAVGDLAGNGQEDVIATTLEGRVYAWGPDGTLLNGFPILMNTGVKKPAIPRPALQYTRLPAAGAVSGPVLYDIGGTTDLEIIQTGWDGYVHVWEPDGSSFPGWPVKVRLPSGTQPDPGTVFINDQKLDTPAAIAYLNGQSSAPDIVVRPQYTQSQAGGGLGPGAAAFVFAYSPDGSLLPNWPVKMPGTLEYYGSAQEFVTEGNSAPAAADPTGSGSGPDMVALGPIFTPPYLIDAAGTIQGTYGPMPSFSGSDVPVPFTTSGAFGKMNGVLTFGQAETGSTTLATSLLNSNSGGAIKEFEVTYPSAGGSARPGYPVQRQGIDFLGEPIFVDVTGDGSAEVVDGGDASALMAWDGTGSMAPGFPKWTTGWTVFSPTAGDLFGDGKVELVVMTREGYLMAWKTDGVPSGLEWWRASHDEWNTGRWGTTIPP